MRMTLTWSLFLGVCVCLLAAAAEGADIEAITRPSKDVTLSFVSPGRIAKVVVKEGDVVKDGQLLVRQDDAAERVRLAKLEAKSKNTDLIEARKAQLAQKKVELEKLEDAFTKRAVSRWDVEQARLAVRLAEAQLALDTFEHEQDQREYEQNRIQLARMHLESPVAGKVEEVFVKPGESADALEDVIRVVKIDPLWIEVPVPLAGAGKLEVGGPVRVKFPDETGEAAPGKIIHIAAVADAASTTLTVRVELANPTGRPAGEHVNVDFPVRDTRLTR